MTTKYAENTLAAAIQMRSGEDRSENLAVAAQLMDQAVRLGAQLLTLPENFSFMGKSEADKRHQAEEPDNSPSLTFLRNFAREKQVWIVGGSIPFRLPGNASSAFASSKVTNTCCVVNDQGEVVARYDKIHMFDVSLGDGPPFRESDVIRPGTQPVTVETPFGMLGLSICYDLRFPELYRRLTAAGAEILTIPSAFTLTTGKDHWELLLRARAVENFAYVLAPNQWGRHSGGRRTYGHSMIVEPWGCITSRCPDGAGFAIAPIERQRIALCRQRIPCLKHRML
jgi:nitrilase